MTNGDGLGWGGRVLFPEEVRPVSLFHSVDVATGAHAASYSIRSVGSSSGIKAEGAGT